MKEITGSDNIQAIGESLTPRRYAEIISKALGVPVTLKELSNEEFESRAQSDDVYVKELYLNMKCVTIIGTSVVSLLTTFLRFVADHWQPEMPLYDESSGAAVYPARSDLEKFVKENARFKAFAASLA